MTNSRVELRKVHWIEGAACLSVCVIFACLAGYTGFKSAALAGLASCIPNACRKWCAFRHHGSRAARLILKGFYQGEVFKFSSSMILCAGIFAWCSVNPLIFLGTYIGLHILIGFAPLLIDITGGH